MKKLLFATVFASTAIASSMGCNADSLTGLHFGLGVSVLFDKYEADVDVATIGTTTNLGIKTVQAKVEADVPYNLVNNSGIQNADNWGSLMEAVFSGTIGADTSVGGTKLLSSGATTTTTTTAYIKRNTFKKRTTNCGGEIKLAYFHDFGNHLMVGVDLTGVIASKNKKTIDVKHSTLNAVSENPSLSLFVDENKILNATYASGYTATLNDSYTYPTNGNIITKDATISVSNSVALHDANEGFDAIIGASDLPANYALKVDADNAGELTFEKSVFNPRLAFIVGGTVYGWFAGLRLGMSYTTGKVYATGGQLTGQGTNSKTVSISSPLIGLHLMKQMKIAGNNDAHLYLTADWNIGDGRRTVDINGVKSFRQTGYNISAGLTWRFKLGN